MGPIGEAASLQHSGGTRLVSHDKGAEGERTLRDVAQKLEASFLAEMLKHAGVGQTPEAFGGGTGEDQFASFLREAHAEAIAEAGGIGLAEQLFQALKDRAQ